MVVVMMVVATVMPGGAGRAGRHGDRQQQASRHD
jgi:hypothetical protein